MLNFCINITMKNLNENLGEQHNDFCYLGGKWNKLQMFLLYKCYYAFCQFYYLIVVRDRKLAKYHKIGRNLSHWKLKVIISANKSQYKENSYEINNDMTWHKQLKFRIHIFCINMKIHRTMSHISCQFNIVHHSPLFWLITSFFPLFEP